MVETTQTDAASRLLAAAPGAMWNEKMMAKDTRRCPLCGHSYAYHTNVDGALVCEQCNDNDPTAPCADGAALQS